MAPCRLQVLPMTSRMQGSLKERLSCLISCLSSCPASFLFLATSLHLGWVFSLHAYVSPLVCKAPCIAVWAVQCAMPGDGIVYEWRPLELCGTAAAAKSLPSCPTLCDPIDGSPQGSSVSGILQARTLEWVAISFSMWHYVLPEMQP